MDENAGEPARGAMLKIGLVRLVWLALFGLVTPFGVYRLSRRVGVTPSSSWRPPSASATAR